MSSPLFTIDLGTPVSSAVDWLTQHLGGFFDAISSVMTELVNAVLFVLTAPHPLVITVVFTVLAFLARKWGFAAFTVVAFLLIQGMACGPRRCSPSLWSSSRTYSP